jgi:hypothetical protein
VGLEVLNLFSLLLPHRDDFLIHLSNSFLELFVRYMMTVLHELLDAIDLLRQDMVGLIVLLSIALYGVELILHLFRALLILSFLRGNGLGRRVLGSKALLFAIWYIGMGWILKRF